MKVLHEVSLALSLSRKSLFCRLILLDYNIVQSLKQLGVFHNQDLIGFLKVYLLFYGLNLNDFRHSHFNLHKIINRNFLCI